MNAAAAAGCDPEGARALLEEVCTSVSTLKTALDQLERVNAPLRPVSKAEHARLMRDKVIPAQNEARAAADRLERLMPDDLWPLPTYRDLLFVK